MISVYPREKGLREAIYWVASCIGRSSAASDRLLIDPPCGATCDVCASCTSCAPSFVAVACLRRNVGAYCRKVIA